MIHAFGSMLNKTISKPRASGDDPIDGVIVRNVGE